ncbi:MAG: hypothetical protein EOM20_20355 [Spartobacteria bacterium]|nr:hypothetical protein [Spartobacteria bacterium]
MSRKKKHEDGENNVRLDSFVDILTCLVGILVMMILLASIEASQTEILLSTPMRHATDKCPLFFECRSNQIFRIDLERINARFHEELNRIEVRAGHSAREILPLLKDTRINEGPFILDLSHALVGRILLYPGHDVRGMSLDDLNIDNFATRGATASFKSLLDVHSPARYMLTFLVRDDSYSVFKKARGLAWMSGFEVSYEQIEEDEPLKFGLGLGFSHAQ